MIFKIISKNLYILSVNTYMPFHSFCAPGAGNSRQGPGGIIFPRTGVTCDTCVKSSHTHSKIWLRGRFFLLLLL